MTEALRENALEKEDRSATDAARIRTPMRHRRSALLCRKREPPLAELIALSLLIGRCSIKTLQQTIVLPEV
jgi:hypothetical protein